MKISSRVIVVVGQQRSGTTVFRKMLAKAEGVVDLSEIMHSNFADNVNNYYNYLYEKVKQDPTCLHPVNQKQVFREFIAYLLDRFAGKRIIIDIKENAFPFMFSEPSGCSFISEYIRNNEIPVIHVVRRNKLRCIVSEQIAHKTGQWSLADGGEPAAGRRVFINPFKVREEIRMRECQTRQVLGEFSGYCSYRSFFYEDMFDSSGDFSRPILSLAGNIIDGDVEHLKTPTLSKQNNDELKNLITNYDQICESLQCSRWAALLD